MRYMNGGYRPKQSHEHKTGTFRVRDGSGTVMAYLTSNQNAMELWCLLPNYNYPLTMVFEPVGPDFLSETEFCAWLAGQGVDTALCTMLKHTITTFSCD